ncbi:hypothetical protein ACFYTQ_35370 [Nocardia sp. NPDC004068]|uniref:hypothetical protein n=1 Tax=Nocardia sp. NPDC004068 TaxID=3364303 RepID=UPI003677A74F
MIDHRTRTGRRILASAAAALATAATLTVAGCGNSGHNTSPPQQPTASVVSPAPAPAGVDDRQPDQVLTWVAAQVYSWHPASDPSAAAGFDRARPLLDPKYITAVGATAAGLANVTGATWARWATDNATITATARVTTDDHPADTPTTRQRVAAVTQHIADPAATTAEPDRTLIAYMIATREPDTDRWRVSMIAPR